MTASAITAGKQILTFASRDAFIVIHKWLTCGGKGSVRYSAVWH